MARATRSTAQNLEKESSTTTATTPAPAPDSPSRTKTGAKKRKRTSHPDANESAHKQLRSDNAPVKDEDAEGQATHPEQEASHTSAQSHPSSVGEAPIDSQDAQKILTVLEMIDTQGLLDRVFPLQSDPSTSNLGSCSLRTLLQESARHPLRTLRNAVQQLLPISSHPRSKPSKPAVLQQRFCDISFSLLEQASLRCIPLRSLAALSQFVDGSEADELSVADEAQGHASSSRSSKSPPPPPQRRYALVQRLPNGDWWSSINTEQIQSLTDVRSLSTGHAELVAILPTPSAPPFVATSSALLSKSTSSVSVVPTLGSYNPRKTPYGKAKLPEPRRVSCGTFLDYGPYASFAPTFSQEGTEIGREQLGEVLFRRHLRRLERQEDLRVMAEGRGSISEVPDEANENGDVVHLHTSKASLDADEVLDGLLPPEDIGAIKSAMTSLEEEHGVQELLERNSWALRRLEELQRERFSKEGGGKSAVEEGSEEWQIAQAIMESLSILASLRPRTSNDSIDESPLVPPPSILHKLQRTLPLAATPGWHGTLPPSKAAALRDNSTVRMRSGALAATATATNAAAPVASVATAPAAAATATPANATYAGYSYGNYVQQQYRPGTAQASSFAYKPGQPTTTYYPAAYTSAQPGQMTQQQSYYASQGYNVGATGQQPYGYTSWYNYAAQPQVSGTGTPSGVATPQPVTAAPVTMPTSYGAYLAPVAPSTPGTATPTGARTPAVANTVAKPQAAWPAASYPQGVTLPQHLRSGAQTAPGTPVQQNGIYQVATTSAAQS